MTTVYIQRELDREKAFQVFVAVAALAIVIESGIAGKIAHSIGRMLPKREENIFDEIPDWVDRKILERIIYEIKTGSKLGGKYGWQRISGEAKKGD
jgi:hypothetical protein